MSISAGVSGTLKNILLSAAALSAFLLLCEAFLWNFMPVYPEGPASKVSYRQNLPGLKSAITFEQDRYGFRSLSMTERAKPAGTIRILCLGGSTTRQAMQETKDTWYGVLETELRTRYKGDGINIQVAGLGNPGYKAIDIAMWVKENLDDFSPDIVVTMVGATDLLFNGGRNYNYRGLGELFREKRGNAAQYFFKRYSQIYRRLLMLGKKSSGAKNAAVGGGLEWHSRNLPAMRKRYRTLERTEVLSRAQDPVNEFRDVMEWLTGRLARKDVPVILLGEPFLCKDPMTPEEYDSLWLPAQTPGGPVRLSCAALMKEMRKYDNVQSSLAERFKGSGAAYLDLDHVLRKTLDHYVDGSHFTDLGSRAVAKALEPAVQKDIELLLKRGPSAADPGGDQVRR